MNVLKYAKKRTTVLKWILIEFDHEPVELLLVILALLWGLWIGSPLWESFDSTPTYRVLSQLGSEQLWGAVVFIIGLQGLLGLLFSSLKWRRVSSFSSCILWAFLAIAVLASNPISAALPIYFVLSIAAGWIYIRLWMD